METVTIVDTSISTDNLGDEIIMDAVNSVIWGMFPNAYIFRVPSHEALSDRTRKFLRKSDWCFIGGTNLLQSNIRPGGLWRLDEAGAAALGSTRTICLGTGWNDYMSDATPATTALLRTALSLELTHSVRDGYTRAHLDKIGAAAANTACVTMWGLTRDHCATLPRARSDTAIFTLSNWRKMPDQDRAFVELLRQRYKRVFFFSQMHDDFDYFERFGWSDIAVAATTTEAYNHFLENEEADVIGTRLHGGIRAMQKGHRALILAIDNRAAEIGKDTGLPVVERGETSAIADWLDREDPIDISLPQQAIDDWKSQFRDSRRAALSVPERLPEVSRREPPIVHLKRAAKSVIGRG